MHVPDRLAPLFEYGIIEEVVRPLMSGKEAQAFLVVSGGELAVAKVYKEAQNRTFHNRAAYTEGRKVRNSRDQRAIEKRSKHGRAQDEAAWRSTEVDMIRRLHAAGVRVPLPKHFIDGVLIMELIADENGEPAPRLGDLQFEPAEAQDIYDLLIREVVRMLCAGVVHGDFSDFNVLVGAHGPVIIDFPQSVDSAANTNARRLLLRDVNNLYLFLKRFVPNARRMPYAEEMWDLYQQNLLTPETRLGGRYRPAERRVNMDSVLDLIQDADRDERKRREALGLRGGPPEAPPEPRRDVSPQRVGAPPPRAPLPPPEPRLPDRHPPRRQEHQPRQEQQPRQEHQPRQEQQPRQEHQPRQEQRPRFQGGQGDRPPQRRSSHEDRPRFKGAQKDRVVQENRSDRLQPAERDRRPPPVARPVNSNRPDAPEPARGPAPERAHDAPEPTIASRTENIPVRQPRRAGPRSRERQEPPPSRQVEVLVVRKPRGSN